MDDPVKTTILNQNFTLLILIFQIKDDEIKKITQERDQLNADLKKEQQKCKNMEYKLKAEISSLQKVVNFIGSHRIYVYLYETFSD